MNKAQLVEAIAKKLDHFTKADIERLLNVAVDAIIDTVESGDEVSLVGFGTFKASKRAARKGHNPKTGEEIQIPARRVPVFKAGKKFKEEVNKK